MLSDAGIGNIGREHARQELPIRLSELPKYLTNKHFYWLIFWLASCFDTRARGKPRACSGPWPRYREGCASSGLFHHLIQRRPDRSDVARNNRVVDTHGHRRAVDDADPCPHHHTDHGIFRHAAFATFDPPGHGAFARPDGRAVAEPDELQPGAAVCVVFRAGLGARRGRPCRAHDNADPRPGGGGFLGAVIDPAG